MSKILFATPTNPKMLSSVLNESSEFISRITIISIDFPPIEIYNSSVASGTKDVAQSVFNKKQDQAVMFDIVGLIVEINAQTKSLNNTKNKKEDNKKLFIVANEVMFITNEDNKLVSVNGNFNLLPQELITKVYTNFPELKSVDLSELEDFLEVSKDDTAIKAFNKLGHYFSAQKYEINNNIFSLVEHQEQAEAVAKKVLLKKMVAWEIRK